MCRLSTPPRGDSAVDEEESNNLRHLPVSEVTAETRHWDIGK
jgi:hypothetical protein